jgi:hypothetical protein
MIPRTAMLGTVCSNSSADSQVLSLQAGWNLT